MKKLFALALLFGFISCHRQHVSPACTVAATVVDISSSGGCGFAFQLTDGSVLVPVQHHGGCGHNMDALANFTLADGLKVNIGYNPADSHDTACKAGKSVEITCITAEKVSEK